MSNSIAKPRWVLLVVIIAAIALPPLTLLLPKPPSFQGGGHEFYSTMVVTLIFSILYLGSALLFTLGLKDFKPQLKRAYFLICIALVLIGINYLQYPLFNILDLWESAWFTEGGANAFYLVGTILLFWGIRRFAAILEVKSIWSSRILLAILLILTGAAGYAAARLLNLGQSPLDVDIATESMLCIPLLMAALLAWDIKQTVGPAYTEALTSFAWALLASALGGLVPIAYDIGRFPKSAILGIPSIIASILFMNAADAFNQISTYAGKKGQSASPIEIVMYLASLASNQKAIDPILDSVRAVTAQKSTTEETLSEQEQSSLAETYKRLEVYLTEQESVQVFTKDSLRQRIENKFTPNKTTNSVFWQRLG